MTDPTPNPLLDSLAKPPPPPSELDELMQRDPLELSAQDIDKIIAFQRQSRARREAGGKTKKDTGAAATTSIDLSALVKGIVAASTAPKPAAAAPVVPSPALKAGFRRI